MDHLTTYDQFVGMLKTRKYEALETAGAPLIVDTTNFEQVDYEGLVEAVRALQHEKGC